MKPNSTPLLPLAALLLLGAAANEPHPTDTKSGDLTVTSKDFVEGGKIPVEHTCDGPDRSPSITWSGAPSEAKAFAIVLEDPDAPNGTFLHWIAWNVPGAARALDRGVPAEAKLGDGTIQGKNDFDRVGYGGPCPPKGTKHQYVLRLYALGAPLELDEMATSEDVKKAAKKAALADAKLTASYERSSEAGR